MFSALVILGSPEAAPLVRSMIAATGQIMVMRELPAPPGNYELARLLNSLCPDLVILDLTAGQESVECVARIRAHSPQMPVVGIGCSTEAKLLARQAGLSTYVGLECTPEELRAAIRRALELHQGGVQPSLYAFLPSKAGSGCSTVVLNTAVAAARLGKRTLVIDADLRSSVLALMLGVEAAGGTQAVLQSSGELDTFVLRRNVVAKHGVDFLLSTRTLDFTPPEWANYFQLLNFVQPQYDLILVDMPELVNPATYEVVRRSEKIFPVTTPEISALKLTIQRLTELERLGVAPDRIHILLNRVHPAGPPLAELEGLLGRPVEKAFPNNYPAVAAAIADAAPVAPDSSLGQAFTAFAASLAGIQYTPPEPTFRERLKGLLHLASA